MNEGGTELDNNTDNVAAVENSMEVVELPDEGPSDGTSKISPSPGTSIQFKRPLLIGPRKGVRKLTSYKGHEPAPEKPNEAPNENVEKEEKVEIDESKKNSQKKVKKSPAEMIQENATPLPYKEPKWSGLPPHSYSLEVLKSGQIVETVNLNDKSYYVFGRLANLCDVVLAHPTVSRFHAVLQYRLNGDDRNPPGFYIYDLESTHGTFLNKQKINTNTFIRVHVGHMLKFGWSTRNFILQGPDHDAEPESDLSVTEMKEMSLKKKLAGIAANTGNNKEKEEDPGVDWGLGEDADEETDLSENPYASTQNEELYINDPKKTLRGWFEREGYELEYNCEEKGYGQYICRVELPIDDSKGLPVIAEATVRGKKKEAVIQCALEACRVLDRYGLLRQSNHESKKRKAKNWEDDDYYDSDEDTFLDRTGTIEKKRQIRMEQAKTKEPSQTVYTYQSLVEQHKKILEDIEKVENELGSSSKKNESDSKQSENENEDELDAFMSNLDKNVDKKDKNQISKLKGQLLALKQEEVKIRNLANIAKPAELPPLKAKTSEDESEIKKPKLPIIGKRKIGVKKPIQVVRTFETEEKTGNDDSGEEVDSD